ncbi:MAG TPA: hypothetical protein HA362_07535 [Nanoarchaeota archaeon]|nr:hypothetical protein [Nanoarchaeota archaeon]
MKTFTQLLPIEGDFRRKIRIPIFEGFLLKDDVFADNRKIYEQTLQTTFPESREYRAALRHLGILEKFPPGVPHDRVVAHKAHVYEVAEPAYGAITSGNVKAWHEGYRPPSSLSPLGYPFKGRPLSQTRQLVPKGRLKKILSADIGEALSNEGNAGIDCIDITFNSERYFKWYEFTLKREGISSVKPLEFHIRQYMAINGIEIDEGYSPTTVAIAMFGIRHKEGQEAPGEFLGFHYFRTRARMVGE